MQNCNDHADVICYRFHNKKADKAYFVCFIFGSAVEFVVNPISIHN